MGFMIQAGYGLADIGLVMGCSRLSTVLCQFLWGDIADRYSPKKILVITEFVCALLAYGILYLWAKGPQLFWYFIAFSSLRASLIAVQNGPRGKLTKIFSDESLQSNINTAAWLNKVTHGSFLIAALLSIYFLKHGSFKEVIYFDIVGFLIGGLLLFISKEESSTLKKEKENLFKKFNYLFLYAKKPAIFDLLLALSVTGLNMLTVRIVNGDKSILPYFYAIYGLCVWLAGAFKNTLFFQKYNYVYWFGMGLSFLAISYNIGTPFIFIGVLFLYFSYWSIFHLISGEIQKETPAEHVAGVVSARNILMLTVIAIGEFAVGFLFSRFSVNTELIIRGTYCGIIFVMSFALRNKIFK